jgi:hypothetical protein
VNRKMPFPSEGAPASTIDALMFAIREGDGIGGQRYGAGIEALRHPDNRLRLDECSHRQIKEIVGRLKAIRPRYAAITKEVISYVARYPYRKDSNNAPSP